MTYLDWAATAVPDAEAQAQALQKSLECFGNPSSPHAPGKAAKAALELARGDILDSLAPGHKKPSGMLVFTGSGTEADQIVLLSLLGRRKGGPRESSGGGLVGDRADKGGRPHVVISAIEHAAVYSQAQVLAKLGFDISYVKPDSDGRVSPQSVAMALRPTTALVAIMAVNNETGAVQDIPAIAKAVADAATALKSRMPLFHVDCVQALGKIPLELPVGHVSSAAFSAHKIGGPKGIGALWLSRPIEPLASGGGQESGLRSGTENLFGALSFSMCAKKAIRDMDARLSLAALLEKALLDGIRSIPGACVLPQSRIARDSRWSPWIISAAFPGLAGEVFVRALSDAGIAVSTGSACSHTQQTKGRRILDAMGVPAELSFSAIRVSLGPDSTMRDIEHFLTSANDLYRRLKT